MKRKTAALFATYETHIMTDNPLIPFLASYGPTPSSHTMYDECVIKAAEENGCTPLEIKHPLIDEIVALLRTPSPKSVILTGTAGDGKTYTARKIVETLSEDKHLWSTMEKDGKIYSFPHPLPCSERPLRIIKDLSELNETEKNKIFSTLCYSLSTHDDKAPVFILCANDGYLLQFFKGYDPLYRKIIDLLSKDQSNKENPREYFWLINMSRQSRQDIFDDVIDSIVKHPQWENCTSCSTVKEQGQDQRCPILCNRDILRKKEHDSMRARLRDILCLAETSGQHLPIRQLIINVINILLGDHKQKPFLLTCKKARNRAKKGEYSLTNPYANVFGDNLPKREQKLYKIFTVLNDFQIGFKTNNFFEHALLWNNKELPDCPYYGLRIFTNSRDQYLNTPTAEHADRFLEDMLDQRRRLFFSLTPDTKNTCYNPWQLSLFKHGAEYIDMFDKLLTHNKSDKEYQEIARKILCGLNRTMTKTMTKTSSELWITLSFGVYRGHPIPLLIQRAAKQGESTLSFEHLNNTSKMPVIRVTQKETSVDLPLRPLLFEYLIQIDQGALPANFSSDIYQEIKKFQLQIAAMTQKTFEYITPKEIQLSSRGELEGRPITILEKGEDFL